MRTATAALAAAAITVGIATAAAGALTAASSSPAAVSTPMATPTAAPAATLAATGNAYYAALFAGDGARAARYLDPATCTPSMRAAIAGAATQARALAHGATITVTGAAVNGTTGTLGAYSTTGLDPAFAATFTTDGQLGGAWVLRNGTWLGTCA